MGQTLSVHFRQSITLLCRRPAPTDDDELWKALFFTSMTSEEIGAFISTLDVRMMRRAFPQNLALLLYKCMQQMAAFVENVEACYSGQRRATDRRFTDDTAVLNALRIVAALLPPSLEDRVLDVDRKGTPANVSSVLPTPPSEWAEHFAQRFYWCNMHCDGSSALFTNVLQSSKQKGRFVPLGEEVVELITRLCFLPSWTLDKSVVSMPHPLDLDRPNRVISEYLLCPGLLGHSVPDGALLFAREVKSRRYECIRALLACLTTPVSVGDPLAVNPFFDVLANDTKVALGPTLCCSLINYVSLYVSRGVLPFTSHFWSELPEAFLADALQLLSVMLGWPHKGIATQEATAYYTGARNSWWCLVHSFSLNPDSRSFIAHGLFNIIENPLFAATTFIVNSQRRLKCVPEALQLTVRLVTSPCITGFLDAFAELSDALIFPLLYVFQLAKADREHFADAQTVAYILLKLSLTRPFLQMLQKAYDGVMPFAELPAPKAGATYGDVLVLVICDILSPSAPKWVWPLSNACAVLLANVASSLSLQEAQNFEVFHVLDYVTAPAFNRQRFVDRDSLVVSLVDVVVAMSSGANRVSAAPLIASLATVDIPSRLRGMVDPEAPLLNVVAEPSISVDLTSGAEHRFALSAQSTERLQLAPFTALSEFAHRIVSDPANESDPLSAIQREATNLALSLSHPVLFQDMEITEEIQRYLTVSLWAVVHRHHLQPPLFHADTCSLFRPAIELTPDAIEALMREQDARISRAAEAAAERRRAAAPEDALAKS